MMAVTKSVVISVRVSEEVVNAIDTLRGGRTRSAWVASTIDVVLHEAKPADKIYGTLKERRSGCPHPRARVIKGFCYACGKPATI